MEIEQLDIDNLKDVIKNISPVQCNFYAEACIVTLENQNKTTGVTLTVTGSKSTSYNLTWHGKRIKNGWKESKKSTENAAVALSFFLTKKLTEFTILEEATIGTGFDYWLCYEEGHPDFDEINFMNARLEISGIANESGTNTLEKRVKDKLEQTKPTDYTMLPAYISVIEFSNPKAHFIKK